MVVATHRQSTNCIDREHRSSVADLASCTRATQGGEHLDVYERRSKESLVAQSPACHIAESAVVDSRGEHGAGVNDYHGRPGSMQPLLRN